MLIWSVPGGVGPRPWWREAGLVLLAVVVVVLAVVSGGRTTVAQGAGGDAAGPPAPVAVPALSQSGTIERPVTAPVQPRQPSAAAEKPLDPVAPDDAPAPTAEAGPAVAPALSDADLQSLVTLLEDDAARQAFTEHLKALLASRQAVPAEDQPVDPAATLLESVSERIKAASAIIVDAVEIVVDAQEMILAVGDLAIEPQHFDLWWQRFADVALILGVALALKWLLALVLRRSRQRLREQASERIVVRLVLLAVIAVVEFVPIAAFATAAYLTTSLIEPDFPARRIALYLITGYVLAQAALVAVRLAVAPASPGLRVLTVTDAGAQGIDRIGQWIIGLGFYGYYGLKAVYVVGLPTNVYLILLRGLGLVIALTLISAIIANRQAVGGWIRGSAEGDKEQESVWQMLRRRAAGTWHFVAIVYVLAVLIVWSSGVEEALPFLVRGTILSIVTLLAASALSLAIGRAFENAIAARANQSGRRYLAVIRRLIDVIVYAFAILLILEAWGVDSIEWLTSDRGRRMVGSATTVLLVIAGTFAISELLNVLIERYLSASDQSASEIERHARARTLLPLARKALLALLIVLAVFIILSELGIDVAPLIAGAGVAGIAIGFGAQSLVKDVIAGFFILLENTMAVGDVVDIDGNSGVVESMSVRTVVLRDLAGTVHTIPFGSVARIKNLTKDFSYYVADIGVAYREDVDRVIAVIREVGEELRQDPAFRRLMIAPLDVLGLDQFADSAVVIKVRLKTRPIQQWTVGREFNRRLKARFDAEGIEIPFPHRTLYFGVDRGGNAPAAHVRVAANSADAAPAADPPRPVLRSDVEVTAG